MTMKEDTIVQQFNVLKEMNCLESVSFQNAIVGNKYLFYYKEWGFTFFYIGELSKINVICLSTKTKIYKFQFKSSVKVDQFLPTFCGCDFVSRNSSFDIAENSTYFKLFYLNYSNYLKNSK